VGTATGAAVRVVHDDFDFFIVNVAVATLQVDLDASPSKPGRARKFSLVVVAMVVAGTRTHAPNLLPHR